MRTVLFLVISIALLAVASADDVPVSRRGITLEWEPVEDANGYELELISVITKKRILFKSKEPKWTGSINAGRYMMRLRSYDERAVPGPWSEAQEIGVKLLAPNLIRPLEKEEVRTDEKEKATVKFSWEFIPGAKEYRITVVPGELAGASAFEGRELASEAPPDTTAVSPYSKIVSGVETSFELPVAKSYTWSIMALMPDGADGEVGSGRSFSVIGRKLEKPEVAELETEFVQELSWSKPEFAENYDYVLSRKDRSGKWVVTEMQKKILKEKIPLSAKHPGGNYRLMVRANANLRQTSEATRMEFKVREGDRSPAALEKAQLQESIEKPTNWYFIASYLLTSMAYDSPNKETGNAVTFNAVGGTGRLGAGYIFPDKPWGVFGIVDMSGFNIDGQNRTFASSEIHAVWRKFYGTTQIRAGGGLHYKELPETLGRAGAFETKKIAMLGTHGGFEIWRPLTRKYGIQFNSRAYLNLLGMTTPNGEGLVPTITYQFGIMGSMRLKKSMTGFAGYTYRIDNASYKAKPGDPLDPNFTSVASPGDVNNVRIGGHYLNFILETGF